MEFAANREALVRELGIIRTAVEKKNTIPVLAFALFDVSNGTLRITGTDLDITIITSLAVSGDDGAFCVPALQLFTLLRLFSDEEVRFTLEKNERVKITCGKSKHLLPTLKPEAFPAVDETKNGEKVSLASKTLQGMLKAALLAVSADVNEHKAHCVSVSFVAGSGTLDITGTTEKHLLNASVPISETVSFDVMLPRRAAQALIGFAESESIEMEISENHAVFACEPRKLIARLALGKYVAWRIMIPDVEGHKAKIPLSELQVALKRASVTSEEYRLIRAALSFEFSKTNLTIESRETESGQSTEPVQADCPSLNGDKWIVGIHGTQVLDFLGIVESDSVFCEMFPPKIVTDKDGKEKAWPRPLRFTPAAQGGFSYQYFTNPVRLD